MGFNKYYVPEPKEMIRVLENGVSIFFNGKIDALIGNTKSMQMIDDAWGFLNMEMSQEEIIKELKKRYRNELS